VTFTCELIANRDSLSCHYKCDYSTNALIIIVSVTVCEIFDVYFNDVELEQFRVI